MTELSKFLSTQNKIRIDIWLWAGRFFKTRSLCKQAIEGGKVQQNGQRSKPSRPLSIGDHVQITRGQEKITIEVMALAEKRGPASIAQQLYRETEESIAAREKQSEIRRINQAGMTPSNRKPDKKQRRQIHRFKSRN